MKKFFIMLLIATVVLPVFAAGKLTPSASVDFEFSYDPDKGLVPEGVDVYGSLFYETGNNVASEHSLNYIDGKAGYSFNMESDTTSVSFVNRINDSVSTNGISSWYIPEDEPTTKGWFFDITASFNSGTFGVINLLKRYHTMDFTTNLGLHVGLPSSWLEETGLYVRASVDFGFCGQGLLSWDAPSNGLVGGRIEFNAPKKNGVVALESVNTWISTDYDLSYSRKTTAENFDFNTAEIDLYAKAGYLYSTDKDPSVSGVYLSGDLTAYVSSHFVNPYGDSENVAWVEKTLLGLPFSTVEIKANALFHRIDNKIVVEDGLFNVLLSKEFNIDRGTTGEYNDATVGFSLGYDYSYLLTEESNGFNLGIVAGIERKNTVITDASVVFSFHRNNGVVSTEVSEGDFNFHIINDDSKLGCVEFEGSVDYVYSFENDVEENGLFVDVDSTVTKSNITRLVTDSIFCFGADVSWHRAGVEIINEASLNSAVIFNTPYVSGFALSDEWFIVNPFDNDLCESEFSFEVAPESN